MEKLDFFLWKTRKSSVKVLFSFMNVSSLFRLFRTAQKEFFFRLHRNVVCQYFPPFHPSHGDGLFMTLESVVPFAIKWNSRFFSALRGWKIYYSDFFLLARAFVVYGALHHQQQQIKQISIFSAFFSSARGTWINIEREVNPWQCLHFPPFDKTTRFEWRKIFLRFTMPNNGWWHPCWTSTWSRFRWRWMWTSENRRFRWMFCSDYQLNMTSLFSLLPKGFQMNGISFKWKFCKEKCKLKNWHLTFVGGLIGVVTLRQSQRENP